MKMFQDLAPQTILVNITRFQKWKLVSGISYFIWLTQFFYFQLNKGPIWMI